MDTDILSALECLGKEETLPSDEVIQQLEKFVCILYGFRKIKTLDKLRWIFYSRKQAKGENLPPTLAALRQHIYRAHYMAMVWRRNMVGFQHMPPPESYGWIKEQDRYEPVLTLNCPAPKAVINLMKCNYKK